MNCLLTSYATLAPTSLFWPLLEITGALAVLVLLPGYALVLGLVKCPGRAWLASGWALGLGVAWNAVLILLWRVLGFPLNTLVVWSPLASLALCFIVLRARTLRTPSSQIPGVTRSVSFAALATIAAAALAFIYAARTGTPITYYSDSPDHIATIRRIISTGDPFPLSAYYDPLSYSGHDLRKGLWHPQVALLSILTQLDPYDAWRMLAAPLAALFVLNAAAFGYLIGGPGAAAIAAWALLLTFGSSLTSPALRQAVFATRLSDQLSMATFIAVLQDIRRPAAGTRWCSASLAMAAVFTHVFGAVYLAVVLGGLGLGLLIRDRHISDTVRRLSGTAALMALVCTPYLVWRVAQSSGPLNAIHAQPQGLLTLWDSVRVVMPGVLWE